MSKSKKPRKAYRGPKYATGALPIKFGLSQEAKTNLRLPPHLILEAYKTGKGDEQGAHTLAACVNIGVVLARKQTQEAQQVMSAALEAMHKVMDRGNQTGKWGMSGDEMKAIGESLNLTDDMQDCVTREDMREVIKTVYQEAA